MHANNNIWPKQFCECIREVCVAYSRFKHSEEPDTDDLDKAMTIYNYLCIAYEIKNLTFEEIIETGESLRTGRPSSKGALIR